MPTYEYICETCKHEFELFQSMKDEPLKSCPVDVCPKKGKAKGKGKVKRAISSGAGLIFKGSGFYITDYRSEGYKEAAKKDSAGGQESAKGSDGAAKKTDSSTSAGNSGTKSSGDGGSKSSKPASGK